MQKDSKFFDDIARVASSAAGELMEMKREMDSLLAVKMEAMLQKMNLASREEFDTLQAMLSKIRLEQEAFKQRLDGFEQLLESLKKAMPKG